MKNTARLTEYGILVAFLIFTIMGFASELHTSLQGVTTVTNSNLTSATTAVH